MTESATDPPAVGVGGRRRAVGVGVLASGLVALVVALLLPGLPIWVRVVAAVLVVLGVVVVVWRLHHRWLAGLGTGAAVVAIWAVYAGIGDIRFGLPGTAIPVLAVGGLTVAAGAALLARVPGSVAPPAFPAAIAFAASLVVAGVLAGVTVVVAPRIAADATTADPAEPAAVPGPSTGVRWTTTWPHVEGQGIQVVAAGAGVVVASGDRVVAFDGATGTERWHYRRPGAHAYRLTASPDGRTAVATFTFDDDENDPTNSVFAFDANTGDLRWSRWPVSLWGAASFGGMATDHTFVKYADKDGPLVGVDLGSGEELWRWTPPSGCRSTSYRTGPDAVLVPVFCGDPVDGSYAVIGLDDRDGTQRWRFAGPTRTQDVDLTTSPDGRTALVSGGAATLLDSATGAVRYQPGDGARVIAPDARTPVLRRESQLVVRDLPSGTEHTLGSGCTTDNVRAAITQTSVVVLCLEPDLRVDAYSRSDGTHTARLTGTEAVGELDEPADLTGPLPAPGAIVLAVRDFGGRVAGLT